MRLRVDGFHLVDGVFLALGAVHSRFDRLQCFLDEGIRRRCGRLGHIVLGLLDQLIERLKHFSRLIRAHDLGQLGVQVVVELVQRGDLLQRRQAVIVDDAVDLVDRIRHKLRQLFVLDGLPQVFQRTGSVDVLDKVFVLLDDILQLLQLFLIGTVFQRLFQRVAQAVDIGLLDLLQRVAQLFATSGA